MYTGESVAERQQRIITSILHSAPDLLDDVSRSITREREQRRITQLKYRTKNRQIPLSLEHDIQQLRQQIQRHEVQRRNLVSVSPTIVTPWIVVSEYFRLFRNGFKGSQASPSNFTSNQTPYEETQMNFLREFFSPRISVNSGFGLDALIQEWLAVPLMCQDMTVHLLRLEYDEGNTILAFIQTCATITAEMLRCEFPYFVDRQQDHKTFRLMTKLVGQQLVIRTTVRFEWDSVTRRVLGLHYSSDLVTPFLKLLGNLQDTARVLENSLLSKATNELS
ncbi:hypothetical protein PHMEG_00024185 [Phytophthora megakarya]|uniref:Bzip transcription factor n=1 Tax=Phytophthora megakarya TaxID=4795 RepID=A0A225VFT3_9STRA|nr:hypothetical protein PHMEG_00024185 [Phytophthora megakarya]